MDRGAEIAWRRQALASELGVREALVDWSYDALGRPTLPPFDAKWRFSVSHKPDARVLAIAPCSLGVDLEPRQVMTMPSHMFTDRERAWVARAAEDPSDFPAIIWTAKEALLKSWGWGLRVSAAALEVLPAPLEATISGDWMHLPVAWAVARPDLVQRTCQRLGRAEACLPWSVHCFKCDRWIIGLALPMGSVAVEIEDDGVGGCAFSTSLA